MTERPISTRPPSVRETKIQEKFDESIAGQSELMDKLGQQLIVLELAIPGLHATALKLISGDDATLDLGFWLFLTYGCWGLALLLTVVGLIPKEWQVDRNILKQDPAAKSDELGIEDFFKQSAAYKRKFHIAAIVLFFIGTVGAVISVI